MPFRFFAALDTVCIYSFAESDALISLTIGCAVYAAGHRVGVFADTESPPVPPHFDNYCFYVDALTRHTALDDTMA